MIVMENREIASEELLTPVARDETKKSTDFLEWNMYAFVLIF